MEDAPKVKILKKIKVKKMFQTPVKPQIAPDKEEIISNTANLSPSPDNNDDDDFEKLLNDFISSELDELNTDIDDMKNNTDDDNISSFYDDTPQQAVLKDEESSLYQAYNNYILALKNITTEHHLSLPVFSIKDTMLIPRFKPGIGKKIAKDVIKGWDNIFQAFPALNINFSSSDEELLDLAEQVSDENLQLALISYVEILIEIESCEISYEERRLAYYRKKIEKEIIEEHQNRITRLKKYIDAIENNKFPIDATRLINNFFKTAQKDKEGAYQMLTHNPAVFSPIEINKIKPRLFGLLKATPQDGIRINIELGKFIEKLKF